MPTTEVTNGTRAIVKVGRNEIEVIVLEATEHGWRVRATNSGREFEVREITRIIEEQAPIQNFDLATGEVTPLESDDSHVAEVTLAALEVPVTVQEAGTPEEPEEVAEQVAEEPSEPAAEPNAQDAPAEQVERAPAPAGARPLSLVNAAAVVLEASDEPMRVGPLMDAILERGLWAPTTGRTPIQSLYSGIFREIQTKGENARFLKLDRGLFAFKR